MENNKTESFFKSLFRHTLKLLVMSLMFIGIATALGIIYGFAMHVSFTFQYVFDANFAIGVAIILAGFFYMFFPSSMLQKGDKFLDHSTFVERSFKTRKRRQTLAMDILLVGICIIVIPGFVQVLLNALA